MWNVQTSTFSLCAHCRYHLWIIQDVGRLFAVDDVLLLMGEEMISSLWWTFRSLIVIYYFFKNILKIFVTRESSHLLVHSPNACSGWGWAGLKLGVGNSIPTRLARTQVLEPSPAASRGATWQEAGIRNRARTQALGYRTQASRVTS